VGHRRSRRVAAAHLLAWAASAALDHECSWNAIFRPPAIFTPTRGGFHSVRSAKRELLLFVVVYLFTATCTDAPSPDRSDVPEHGAHALYRLINTPSGRSRSRGYVKEQPTIAEFLLPKAAADRYYAGDTHCQRSRINSEIPAFTS